MNRQSSRAHTIFTLKMESKAKSGASTLSQMSFVDLAGRENERTTLATGERLIELSYINKSLFHLANCINVLGSSSPKSGASKQWVQFRNSKLTMLLSESL